MARTRLLVVLVALAGLMAAARPAHAQAAQPGGCAKWSADSQDLQQVIGTSHTILVKDVQIDCNDIQLFADHAEVFTDIDRIRATGNVVFVSGDSRIAAERMEFNTKTKTGTFYIATGIANLEARGVEHSFFGSQEPDAYFYGETIEKLGPKVYRITRGGFTTCVQPTPRWEMVATSVTLTLQKRAVLTNMLLKVKDVPVFYLPAMYFPINKENRATGFLIPIYGASTIKGQTINNAFFWAINRSQDATLYHSFYSKTGQGFGGEYRYVETGGSSGNIQTSVLREHEADYEQPDGSVLPVDGVHSYQINGTLTQTLPLHLRLSGNANYFSSLVAQQRSQQGVFEATNRQRSFGTNVSGTWGANSVSGTVDRSEVFTDDTHSTILGSLPRIHYSFAEKPIDGLPVYFGTSADYVTLVRVAKANDLSVDQGLTRIDLFPTIRFPFTKLPYLTFNTSMGFRETYWNESLVNNLQVPESVTRHYFRIGTTITGPVFTKIFNTPRSNYAQKWKHVIEPTLTLDRTSTIDNRNSIVQLDGTDQIIGGATSATYALNNRLYAKKESAREIVTVSISQTYYTDPNSAIIDQNYQSNNTDGLKPTNFSPVAIQAHVTPTPAADLTFRTEYDTQVNKLRTFAANGGISHGWVVANAGWSLNRFIPDLPGFNVLAAATHYLTSTTSVRKPGNALSTTYSFNYDLRNTNFLNQRIIAHYNTQCCGIAVEYAKVNYGIANAQRIGVPKDHRFNLSFTLAGIGTFSDLFGAFGGQQGR
jgi:LPS-assembly protein